MIFKTEIRDVSIAFLALVLAMQCLAFGDSHSEALALVQKAAEAQGGAAKLRALKSAQISRMYITYHREQSERPEGPWVFTVSSNTQDRNFEHGTVKTFNASARGYATSNWWDSTEAFTFKTVSLATPEVAASNTDGKFQPGSMASVQDAAESLALGPEKILVTAMDAPDLHLEPDAEMHGFMQNVVAFGFKGNPVRVFLNPSAKVVTAVEITRARPYNNFWSPWGDVATRTTFGQWTLEPNGIRYPRLWQVESDGRPDTSMAITQVRFDVPWEPSDFKVPENVKAQFKGRARMVNDVPFGNQGNPPHELAPGVVKVAASWDIIEVKQDDGIVIFEGPLSSGYSSRVMEDAKKRFPGLPIKAVVTTSDSWPHIGGMREYVAQGVPIYALDLNKPILERLFKAQYKSFPDALAKSPKQPKWHIVSSKTVLGTGPNRLEIYPYRTATGERQMMVYLPRHKLLYTSDLFAINDDGTVWLPGFAQEMVEAVKREGLDVSNVVGMHYDLTPLEKVEAAIAKH